jgi:selenocysteine-specific translation elongation factor
VLGTLAREKDGYAQKKLLEGLQHPEKALIPPEKALQLLSYDVHAETYQIARSIVSKPPNAAARREALRLLAGDASAAPVFEKILRDKDELAEIRQISASALQALKPEKLRAHAREMLLDNSEYDDIQATSLTALAQFGGEAVAKDEALMKRVDRLRGKASAKVKQSARRFLDKYGR